VTWTELFSAIKTEVIMTSKEFHGVVEDCSYEFGDVERDAPLTIGRLVFRVGPGTSSSEPSLATKRRQTRSVIELLNLPDPLSPVR